MCIFLLGIAPGHTRGIIKYALANRASGPPTDRATLRAGRSCCQPAPSDKSRPAPPRGHCAICQIVATLDLPPALIQVAPLIVWLGPIADEQARLRFVFDVPRRRHGRAPPTIA